MADIFTLDELAKRHGQIQAHHEAPPSHNPNTVNMPLTDSPYRAAHRAACVSHGWQLEENVTGQPVMLSDDEYLEAIATHDPKVAATLSAKEEE